MARARLLLLPFLLGAALTPRVAAQDAASPPALRVEGDVATPRSWTPAEIEREFAGQVKDVPWTSRGEARRSRGVPLVALVQASRPALDAERKHHELAFVVVVRARDGYVASFSFGELDTALGGAEAWIALDDAGPGASDRDGPPSLLVTKDGKRSRWVRGLEAIVVVDPVKGWPAAKPPAAKAPAAAPADTVPSPTQEPAMPAVGSNAPAFRAQDGAGTTVTLADLKGRWAVLYFYPKDDTPGCTVEACEFTASIRDFEGMDAVVFGVSPDTPESHRAFAQKHALKVRLLSDPDHAMLEAYGAWGEKNLYGKKSVGVIRSTVLIDPQGVVAHVWPAVKAQGHAEAVRVRLAELRAAAAPKKAAPRKK